MNQIIENLREIGFSEKESLVYVSLIELGEASAHEISKRADLNRITTYHVLKSLKEKGIISSFDKNNVQKFAAIGPERLISILDDRKERIKAILPQLKAKQGVAGEIKSRVEIFEGKKGIKSIIERLYQSGEKELFAYGNFRIAEELIKYEAQSLRKLRIKNRIKLTTITNINPKYYSQKNYSNLTRLIISNKMSDITTYVIFGKKIVVTLTFKKDILGILIENEEVAKSHKFVFDLLAKNKN